MHPSHAIRGTFICTSETWFMNGGEVGCWFGKIMAHYTCTLVFRRFVTLNNRLLEMKLRSSSSKEHPTLTKHWHLGRS